MTPRLSRAALVHHREWFYNNCHPTYEANSWGLRLPALRAAVCFLGITWPVRIVPGDEWLEPNCYGMYKIGEVCPEHWYCTQRHLIGLRAHCAPAMASMFLWHELRHARQAEAFSSPGAWWAATRGSYPAGGAAAGAAYLSDPCEVEAWDTMVNHYDVGRLTTYRRRGSFDMPVEVGA